MPDAEEDLAITQNERPDNEPRPTSARRGLTTAELKTRFARFAGMATSAEERAEIDAAFGEDRLDD